MFKQLHWWDIMSVLLALLRDTLHDKLPNLLDFIIFLPLFSNVPWVLEVGVFCRYIHCNWESQLCYLTNHILILLHEKDQKPYLAVFMGPRTWSFVAWSHFLVTGYFCTTNAIKLAASWSHCHAFLAIIVCASSNCKPINNSNNNILPL